MKKFKGIKYLPKNSVYSEMDSPVGKLTLITSVQGLHAILWDIHRYDEKSERFISGLSEAQNDKTIIQTKKQLTEYFSGKRTKFDLPLVLQGTNFQISAWKQLQKIPYAKTISYGEQAEKIGDKNKARAVGMANGSNPIPIVIPCHRVIGGNGKLVGFGGGMERKVYLLNLEAKIKIWT